MAHVTFIHGIANKPAAGDLHAIWLRALTQGPSPLDLESDGITTSMVYWADVLYEMPDTNLSSYEKVDSFDGEELLLLKPESLEEGKFLYGLLGAWNGLSGLDTPDSSEGTNTCPGLERIPLPWFVKKRFLQAYLRDVHHYLFDVEFSPRDGVTYRVQQEIRKRFVNSLAAINDTNHVVVSHSMGTVIAYDCLKRVPGCKQVKGLMTLGSPLGIDEVQDKLAPEWSRQNGYLSSLNPLAWVNVFDRADPVCGMDPKLANDYCLAGTPCIRDIGVTNEGAWRHNIVSYFRQPSVTEALRELLA